MSVGDKSKAQAMRPSVPPILICALSLWLFVSVGITVLRFVLPGLYWIVLAGAIATGALSAVLLAKTKHVVIGCVVVGLSLGLLCSVFHAFSMTCGELPETATGTLELAEDAMPSMYGSSAEARLCVDDGRKFCVKAYFSQSEPLYRYGQMLQSRVRLKAPKEQDAARYWSDGVVVAASVETAKPIPQSSVLSVFVTVRNATIDVIARSSLADNSKAVLQALVCGYRIQLQQLQVNDDFKAAGLAHVVAVSGAHLSIVTALLGGMLMALRFPRWVVIVLQGGFVGAFLLFAAAPISAIRAAIMAWAALLSFVPHRRPSSLNAIGLCIMAIFAVSPSSACSVSFVLSVCSTLGIVLFAPLFSSWIEALPLPIPAFISESLSLTLAASLLTLPYSACLFSQLPVVSPVTNLLAAPLFSLACGGGLACSIAALAVPAFSNVVLSAAGFVSQLLCWIVQAMSHLPYACLPFSGVPEVGLAVSAIAGFALWKTWPRLRLHVAAPAFGFVFAVACVAAVLGPVFTGMRIVMLDVGQGDAILVQDGTRSVLVDTGTNDAMLRSALARAGVVRLDAVIITHGDDDHDGSLAALSQVVQIDSVVIAKDALSCDCNNCTTLRDLAAQSVGEQRVVSVAQGDRITCGRILLEVLWPESFKDGGGNADSLCLLMKTDVDNDGVVDGTALLVGDAEDAQLDQMFDAGLIGKVDVYKVGHHGSSAAIDCETAQRLSPAIALVSVGENNRYGHPVASTLECLEQAGARVFRTDLYGDITCSFKPKAIEVSTQR